MNLPPSCSGGGKALSSVSLQLRTLVACILMTSVNKNTAWSPSSASKDPLVANLFSIIRHMTFFKSRKLNGTRFLQLQKGQQPWFSGCMNGKPFLWLKSQFKGQSIPSLNCAAHDQLFNKSQVHQALTIVSTENKVLICKVHVSNGWGGKEIGVINSGLIW